MQIMGLIPAMIIAIFKSGLCKFLKDKKSKGSHKVKSSNKLGVG